MGIDRNLSSQRPITAPPGDLVTSVTDLKQLQLPDEVLLRKEHLDPFLAGQFAKMKAITEQPEVKSLAADIPEFNYDRAVLESQSVRGLNSDENAALAEWQAESFGDGTHEGSLIHSQSGSTDIDQLEQEIEKGIQDITKAHPEYFQGKSTDSGTSDMLEQMMTGQMMQETEEERKKFWEALAAAKGNPEAVNSIIGMRYANKAMKMMGKVVEAYKYHVDMLDQVQAKLDLQSAKPGGLSQTDMIKTNLESGRLMGDISSLFQILQKSMTDYQRITEDTHGTNKQIAQTLESILRNVRVG